ncbi:M23 family metallopeptidase [Peribacillus kribbensis]|uniref:M23 family metallopeptidase n=1 Tax=Peribacillus kribbensis TaxID=356658 RepID=UPI00041B260B|nr:M23 family metallopeptidase [Peribacillus kribbensis]
MKEINRLIVLWGKMMKKKLHVIYKNKPLLRKLVFLAIILSFGSLHAAAALGSMLPKVYNVSYKGHHLGKVSDKAQVKRLVERKVKQAEEKYPHYSFSMKKEVVLDPEQVLIPRTEDHKVMKKLEQAPVEAKSYSIKVDGKKVAYLPEKKAAEATIQSFKYQYLSKDELRAVEQKNSGNTQIKDIRLTKNMEVSAETVKPDQIVNPNQALDKLKQGKAEIKTYQARQGEQPAKIAEQNDMDVPALLKLNPGLIDGQKLEDDRVLKVEDTIPFADVVLDKEVVETKKVPHSEKIIENRDLPKGQMKIKQQGKNGEIQVQAAVSKENGVEVKKDIEAQQVIAEPQDTIIEKGTKVTPSIGTGTFRWPAMGGVITSKMGYRWGKHHKGIDISGTRDRTINAADNGTVVFAAMSHDGYGNKVVINHHNGYETLYGHLNSISVHAGQTVSAGEKIGIMGSTGDSTGVHLHFEVHKNGGLKNPLEYIHKED